MDIASHAPTPPHPSRTGRGWIILLMAITAYLAVSTLTLPFLNDLWLGELPVLALIQLPKIALAKWLCRWVAMPTIGAFGLSRGSFSPDYVMARPYGLALAYLITLGPLLAAFWLRTGLRPPIRRWAWILLAVAALDFGCTLLFASTRGLTIY